MATVIIVGRGIVAIFGIVYVVFVIRGIRIALDSEISIHSEEVAVPRRTLTILILLLVLF
jgi:hypothetical protein